MKTLKIKLNKATKLKKFLEQDIREDNDLVNKWNQIIKGNTREVDIKQIEELKNVKSEFLINLHLVITVANLKKGKDEEYSNAYYIKKLSELQQQKKFMMMLRTANGKQLSDDKKTTIEYDSLITSSEVTNQIKYLNKEIDNLQNKLTAFNESSTVSITYDPLLKELIESVGIEV